MKIDWSRMVTKAERDAANDPNLIDAETLNRMLAEEGSVVRALAEIMFQEINKLRSRGGMAEYTREQFVSALKAKMRG